MVVMFMRMMVTMKMALKSKVSTGGMILPHPGRPGLGRILPTPAAADRTIVQHCSNLPYDQDKQYSVGIYHKEHTLIYRKTNFERIKK